MEIDLRDANNRYLFGNIEDNGGKILLFIGINPSFGTHLKKDNTMKRLVRISEYYGYSSWLMVNIYPQIESKPKYIDKILNSNKHTKNLQKLSDYFKDGFILSNCDILCGWGVSISKRKYLKKCLLDIHNKVFNNYNLNYYHIDELTNDGHPRHISSQSIYDYRIGMDTFEMKEYIEIPK